MSVSVPHRKRPEREHRETVIAQARASGAYLAPTVPLDLSSKSDDYVDGVYDGIIAGLVSAKRSPVN